MKPSPLKTATGVLASICLELEFLNMYMCVCIYMFVCIYAHMDKHMFVCVCAYMYI